MPRIARRKSETKYINIMIRGINQQNIFADDEDKEKAIKSFREFNIEENEDKCLEIIPARKIISDKEIRQLVSNKYNLELVSRM